MFFETISDGSYFLKTRLGTLKIVISAACLSQIFFEDDASQELVEDSNFRKVFTDWLTQFQSSTVDERWSALSPQGTEFQQQVWRKLLEIPPGARVSYGTIAQQIQRPKANRAVGSAVGSNPISLLIPCHRVVPASGGIGNYRWNPERKRALLEMEQTNQESFVELLLNT